MAHQPAFRKCLLFHLVPQRCCKFHVKMPSLHVQLNSTPPLLTLASTLSHPRMPWCILQHVKGCRKSSLPAGYYQSPCKLLLNIITPTKYSLEMSRIQKLHEITTNCKNSNDFFVWSVCICLWPSRGGSVTLWRLGLITSQTASPASTDLSLAVIVRAKPRKTHAKTILLLQCHIRNISEEFEGTQLPGNKETTQTKQQDTCFQRIIEQSPCMSASFCLNNVIQAFAKLLVCWPAPAFGQYSIANCSQEVDTPSEPAPPLLSHARATVKCRQYVTYNHTCIHTYIYIITWSSATCCPEPVRNFDNKHDNHDHHHWTNTTPINHMNHMYSYVTSCSVCIN